MSCSSTLAASPAHPPFSASTSSRSLQIPSSPLLWRYLLRSSPLRGILPSLPLLPQPPASFFFVLFFLFLSAPSLLFSTPKLPSSTSLPPSPPSHHHHTTTALPSLTSPPSLTICNSLIPIHNSKSQQHPLHHSTITAPVHIDLLSAPSQPPPSTIQIQSSNTAAQTTTTTSHRRWTIAQFNRTSIVPSRHRSSHHRHNFTISPSCYQTTPTLTQPCPDRRVTCRRVQPPLPWPPLPSSFTEPVLITQLLPSPICRIELRRDEKS